MTKRSWTFLILCLSFPAMSWAAKGHSGLTSSALSPGWNKGSGLYERPNSSFFISGKNNSPDNDTLEDELWNKASAGELKIQYEKRQREFEEKQQRGMLDSESEINRKDKMDEAKKTLWGGFREQQIKRRAYKVREAAERDEFFGKRVPQVVIGAVFFAYSDDPLWISNDDRFRLMAKSKLQDQRAQVLLESSVLNTTIYYAGQKLDEEKDWELYKFSVSRGLPVLLIDTSLEYKGTSKTLNAALSKRLTDTITAVVDKNVQMAPDRGPNEERLRLLYGLQF